MDLFSKDLLDDFESVFPSLVLDLTEYDGSQEMHWTNEWLGHAINETVPTGKKGRGMIVYMTCKALASSQKIHEEEENLRLAKVIGWCIEFLQAHALILDDIMDKSVKRRGKTCWYLKENVGVASAIADGFLINESIYSLINKHVKSGILAKEITDIFHKMAQVTWKGQSLDSRLEFNKHENMFTMETYRKVVKYKTCFYSFYYPVILGMKIAGFKNEELIKRAGEILMRIGHLFQVQDDYLDIYGDFKETKKVGTDIQDGKCTWFLVTALDSADINLLQMLKKNIGQQDNLKIEAVKDVYNELGLKKCFKNFEEEEFEKISCQIDEIHFLPMRQLLSAILTANYKRRG